MPSTPHTTSFLSRTVKNCTYLASIIIQTRGVPTALKIDDSIPAPFFTALDSNLWCGSNGVFNSTRVVTLVWSSKFLTSL